MVGLFVNTNLRGLVAGINSYIVNAPRFFTTKNYTKGRGAMISWQQTIPKNGRYCVEDAKSRVIRMLDALIESTNTLFAVAYAEIETILGSSENVFICSTHNENTYAALHEAVSIACLNKKTYANILAFVIGAPDMVFFSFEEIDSLLNDAGHCGHAMMIDQDIKECFVILVCAEMTEEDYAKADETDMEQDAQLADGTESEPWSIESAWKYSGDEPATNENINCFRLAKGSVLIPLDEEWVKVVPSYGEHKTTRIYDDRNRYIDFTWTAKSCLEGVLYCFLEHKDEQGSHIFAFYATLWDLSERVLNPCEMDKYLLTALIHSWEEGTDYLVAQFDELEYQKMGKFRKFIARNKKWLSYVADGIVAIVFCAIFYLAIIGLAEIIMTYS